MGTKLPDQVKTWLDEKTVVTVATIAPDGTPHLSPVWATYDGDDLLMSTIESRQKFKNLSHEARATVAIFPPDNPYEYAEIRGTTTMTREGGRELIDRLCQIYQGEDYPAEPGETRVVIRLEVDRVVGRV